jgi:hypothetical protein
MYLGVAVRLVDDPRGNQLLKMSGPVAIARIDDEHIYFRGSSDDLVRRIPLVHFANGAKDPSLCDQCAFHHDARLTGGSMAVVDVDYTRQIKFTSKSEFVGWVRDACDVFTTKAGQTHCTGAS